jgi:hypothetical protein
VILDQQDQHSQQQSPVGTVWARTVHIVEKLFLYGALFILALCVQKANPALTQNGDLLRRGRGLRPSGK